VPPPCYWAYPEHRRPKGGEGWTGMNRNDRREEKPLVEQLAIRTRYAQIKAALAAKRTRGLQERVEVEMQPNMLEAVMLRARLAQQEQEPKNGHA
jgi:hypothetical protein